MVIGLPSTSAAVTAFPRVLATTRVLPDADGVGFSRSISMQSLFPLISTVIAMAGAPFSLSMSFEEYGALFFNLSHIFCYEFQLFQCTLHKGCG